MFLHSGAGLHGHEYTTHRRSTDLSQKKQILGRSNMRQSLTEPSHRFSTPLSTVPPPHISDQPTTQSSKRPTSLPAGGRSVSESGKARDHHSVRFREEPIVSRISTPIQSEDEESIAGSELTADSDVSSRRRRKQRLPRKSTTFALAHPAPGMRTKQRRLVQFRPKVILQLQEVGEKRAVPAFDVVPSSQIAGSFILPALTKRFPRIFRAKPDLGQNDLLLMHSEHYNISTATDTQALDHATEPMGHRDVLAIISAAPQEGTDRAELTLLDGSTWFIELFANGSYQIQKTHDFTAPVTARWVKRPMPARVHSMDTVGSIPAQNAREKWTFSIIDPAARRHPIMGALTPTSLEIYDNYNTMSASSSRYPPTKSFGSAAGIPAEDQQSHTLAEKRKTFAVTEENKMLMKASAAWISLQRAGWPATAHPKLSRAMSHCRNTHADYPRRSLSLQTDSRESSGEFKSQDSTSHSRGKSAGQVPSAAPPVRSLSAASTFMMKQQEHIQRQQDSQVGSSDGRETPDSIPKPAARKGTMTRLAGWLRNCFGHGGALQKGNQ